MSTLTPDSESCIPEDLHKPSFRAICGLDAVNFVLADVRDGLGPYLAIYLISERPEHGWNEATTGMAMTIAGIVGLVAQTPAGWLIDWTTYKRTLVVIGAAVVALSSAMLPWASNNFVWVALTQSLSHTASAIFAPALAAITLGIVGPARFSRRVGRNEGFNHAGNAFAAGLTAGLAHVYGAIVVFWLIGALAVASAACILLIPAREINNSIGRGLIIQLDEDSTTQQQQQQQQQSNRKLTGFKVLLSDRRLLIFIFLIALFHLANAAMLPTVGQLLTRLAGQKSATTLMAICIVAAQCVMVPTALLVGAYTDRVGRKPIFLVAFGVLTVRGVLYIAWMNRYYLLAVQLLDGVGAGIFGALFPIVVADLTRGTGRFNVAIGAVATAHGLGHALSTTVAGNIIVHKGYPAAFLTLAGIAGLGFVLYAFFMPETKPKE